MTNKYSFDYFERILFLQKHVQITQFNEIFKIDFFDTSKKLK